MEYPIKKIQTIQKMQTSANHEKLFAMLKEIFALNSNGFPQETNGYLLYMAYTLLSQFPHEVGETLLYKRFYKNSRQRYEMLLKQDMIFLPSAEYLMGFNQKETDKYLGEDPLHSVSVFSFYLLNRPITQKLYKLYNPIYEIQGDPEMPAVNVTWYDAYMFGLWVGCRLPSEAEWEYACRAGSTGNNFCETTEELQEHAWFSENSLGLLHPVETRKPNPFGLYDMIGNVWEWCLDSYEEDYYKQSEKDNPVNLKKGCNKVCRGGSMHAFTCMCRSAYRYSEPADYYSNDTGFRLVKEVTMYVN